MSATRSSNAPACPRVSPTWPGSRPSLDAWEARKLATAHGPDAEKFKNEYLAASFADAISIYLLSLYLDVDYHDLRERDYPLLAPTPMAERLRKIAEIFPPNPGFEFNIYYRRRA
jgi:hypothetical protein